MDFSNIIKQKTNDELLEIHRSYYNYQQEFIIQVEHELKARGIVFVPIDYEAYNRQKAVYCEQNKKDRKEESSKNIRKGVLWLLGGLLFTIITFSAAVDFGWGSYIFAGGPMVFGLYLIIDGLINKF